MRQVLFVQGAGKDVHANWDSKLVESLRRALGSAYEVRYPVMPNEADPSYTTWKAALENEFAALNSGAVVIGHSIGGAVLVNAIADRAPPIRLGAIVLIAAPFIGERGWQTEDISPRPDLAARLPADVPILLYHGDEDEIVPTAHVELYGEAIPRASVRRLAGRDHQLDNDLSVVAIDIRALDR